MLRLVCWWIFHIHFMAFASNCCLAHVIRAMWSESESLACRLTLSYEMRYAGNSCVHLVRLVVVSMQAPNHQDYSNNFQTFLFCRWRFLSELIHQIFEWSVSRICRTVCSSDQIQCILQIVECVRCAAACCSGRCSLKSFDKFSRNSTHDRSAFLLNKLHPMGEVIRNSSTRLLINFAQHDIKTCGCVCMWKTYARHNTFRWMINFGIWTTKFC